MKRNRLLFCIPCIILACLCCSCGMFGDQQYTCKVDEVENIANQLIAGEDVNNNELAATMILGALTSEKGINGKELRGVYKRSLQVLDTAVSSKKIGMYTEKIVRIQKKVIGEIWNSIRDSAITGSISGLCNRFGLCF